ncbi:starch-binding protein [Algivirga pacifica]|uniref:Glycosyl hydrolase family 13 catalytic domain-containing protein n=1 Tax=Algivirga pacifica TaxID=1162670 RepID=A0ABP9D0V8_9BACT
MRKLLLLMLLSTLLGLKPVFAQVDFREESIYFLLTTRFFDGDPSNNVPNEWSSYHPDPDVNPEITDPQDVTWRGDFKGLIEKLDYIQDLGFTAIWITPIVQNWSPLDYHGYHAYDFTKVDPRLESPGATFQDLIDEVHARDMKIVLDIVTNHAGRFGIKGLAEIKYNTDPTQPWGQDSEGNPLQPNPNWEYDGMTPNPADGKIWSRANLPTMPAPYNEDLAAYNWPSTESYVYTSDPDWYHHSGNGFAQGWDDTENLYNRALAGDTPDLNTSSQVVRDYLVNAYKTFIDMGVDAFRWDTIKHMSKEDVLYFLDAFKAINPDLFVFGEVAQKRHELHQVEEINPHWYTWRGAVNASEPSGMAVLDFYAEASFHNPFEYGGGFSEVKASDRYDHLYADPSTNLLWLDNHDFGPNNDWNKRYGGTDENLAACLNFMFTWRGIPVVYYGTEMRFKSGAYADIHDATGIEKSIDETGRAYYGDVMDQAPSHVIYKHLKKLNAIRKAVPALQKGTWRWDGNAPGNGVGFVRQHGSSEVAVGLAKDGSASFNFSGLTNGVYRDAVTGKEVMVNNGSLSMNVASGSAGIYVLNGPGMIGANGVGFFEAGVGGPSKPMVSADKEAGQYIEAIDVTLTAALGDGGPYTIYYTMDGSTPTTASTVYTGSINVAESMTIKAMAYDNSGQASDVLTLSYIIDPNLPQTKVYWKAPCGNPRVYFWAVENPGANASTTWPGEVMTDTDGDGWVEFTIDGTCTNVIFSCDGNNQTADLSVCGEGWYDNGWVSAPTPDTEAPTLSISPAGGDFSTSVAVTITATDNRTSSPTIYYTTDGSTPTTASTSGSGTVSFSLTDTTTLKAIAVDEAANVSDVVTTLFNVEEPEVSNGFTVYFKGYNNPRVYHWAAQPAGSLADASWPGVNMVTQQDGWYSYTFPEGVMSTNLIFNDGGGQQTADLTRDKTGWYTDGVWTDTKPGGTVVTGGFTVHFKKPTAWNSTIKVYHWAAQPAGSLADASWPGVNMTDDGNGWYSYTFPEEVTSTNLIFNDGSGNQTTDLSRGTDGWYDNGWSDTASSSRLMVDEVLKPVLYIAPNPIATHFRMSLTTLQTQSIQWQLVDVSGKVVKEATPELLEKGRHLWTVDMTKESAGLYLLRMTTEKGTYHKRLIKQ